MASKGERIDYIDYLKAICGILVVIGHAFSYLEQYYSVSFSKAMQIIQMLIYSVHVPLFFIIAGYFCSRQPVKQFILNKFQRIVIPFLAFATLKLVYTYLISNRFSHATDLINQLFDAYVIGRLYWFSYCIFNMFLIIALLWKDPSPPRKSVLLCAILIITNTVISLLRIDLFPNKITISTQEIINPFYQLKQLLLFFPYMLLGYILHFYQGILDYLRKKKTLFAILALVLIAITLLMISIVFQGNIWPTKFVLTLCLSLLLWLAAQKIPRKLKFLTQIGKYSYQIMLFDSFYKVALFGIFDNYITINSLSALFISAINIFLTCLTCRVVEKIPFIRRIIGI